MKTENEMIWDEMEWDRVLASTVGFNINWKCGM